MEDNEEFMKTGSAQLIPPNPEEDPPPSGAKLHIFKKAAVNSDSEVCSKIGL